MSPIITVPDNEMFTRPEQVIEYWRDRFENNKNSLGLATIVSHENRVVGEFPALSIAGVRLEKGPYGIHTYLYTWRCWFYVMHNTLTLDHQTRSLEDLLLATDIVSFVESDRELKDVDHPKNRVIFSYISDEEPGVIDPNSSGASAIVSTRLSWVGTSEGRF